MDSETSAATNQPSKENSSSRYEIATRIQINNLYLDFKIVGKPLCSKFIYGEIESGTFGDKIGSSSLLDVALLAARSKRSSSGLKSTNLAKRLGSCFPILYRIPDTRADTANVATSPIVPR